MQDICLWFETALGQRVLGTQRAILEQILPGFFGYHLMQLSVVNQSLTSSSPIQHKFSLARREDDKVNVLGSIDSLPFEDDSLDVVLLHHLLDFESSPQRILSEVARVSLPMGHLIIIGFNPISLWGLCKPIANTMFHRKSPWQAKFIRTGRLMDWLNLLNFKIDRAQYCTYGLPFNMGSDYKPADYSQGLSRGANWPFGAIYVIVARKQVGSLIPLRPSWQKHRSFSQLSVVRPTRAATERNVMTLLDTKTR